MQAKRARVEVAGKDDLEDELNFSTDADSIGVGRRLHLIYGGIL